eukprot:13101165-Alexandrium_andersonii.AAC.1
MSLPQGYAQVILARCLKGRRGVGRKSPLGRCAYLTVHERTKIDTQHNSLARLLFGGRAKLMGLWR